MMLRRVARTPSPSDVARQVIDGDVSRILSEQIGASEVDTKGLVAEAATIMATTPKSQWDGQFAPMLHEAMNHVDRRVLLDMRMWHWMCLNPLRDYAVARWITDAAKVRNEGMKRGQVAHFLGAATLAGVSRNALARLYWAADALVVDGDHSLVPTILDSPDFYAAVFERRAGLVPAAAQAAAIALKDADQDERRKVLAQLNYVLSTSVAEALDRDQLINWMSVSLTALRS